MFDSSAPGTARNEMTPDFSSGVISFPWVQSLGNLAFCWIDRAVHVWLEPFRSIHVLQLSFAIGIYVKRKMSNAQPAGVITIFGITFFVPSVYHTLRIFTRRDFAQITSVQLVKNGESATFHKKIIDTKRLSWYDDHVGASLRRCPFCSSPALIRICPGAAVMDTHLCGTAIAVPYIDAIPQLSQA